MKCKKGKLFRESINSDFLCDLRIADSVTSRARGLLFSTPLKKSEGMLIKPCNSVHTMGMSYKLDIVFMDKGGYVVKVVKNLSPIRMAMKYKADCTLELIANESTRLNIEVGQRLVWEYM